MRRVERCVAYKASLTELTAASNVGILVNSEGNADHPIQGRDTGGWRDRAGGVARVEPVPPSEHRFKYRAAYAIDGVRVVGFDNERGKGDHFHIRGVERPYTFTSVEQLVERFIAAVDATRINTS